MNKESIKNIFKIFLTLTLFILINAAQEVYAGTVAEDEIMPVNVQEENLEQGEIDQAKQLVQARGGDVEHAKIFVSKHKSSGTKHLYIQLHNEVGKVIGHIHAKGGSGGFKEVPIGLMPSSSWKSHIQMSKDSSGNFKFTPFEGVADTTYKKSHFKVPNSKFKKVNYNVLTKKEDLAKGRINASEADHTKVLVTRNLAEDETHVHLGHYDANGNLVATESHFEGFKKGKGTSEKPGYYKDVLRDIKEYGYGNKVNIADLGIVREIEAEFKKIATKSDSKIEDAQKVRKKLVKELKDAGRTGEASDVSKVFLMTRPEVTERVKDFNKINMTHNDAEIKKAQAELANLKTVLGSRTKELTNVVLLTKADKNQEITNFGKKRNWKVLRSIENASGNYDLIYEDRRTKDLIAATLPLGSKDIKVKRKTEHKQVIRPKPESKTFANKLKGELDKFIAKGKKLTEEDKEFFELEEKEASKKNVG